MSSSLNYGIFLYFDTNGVLKEIINDAPLRQGNSQVNTLYVYWEGQSSYDRQGYIRIALPDGTLLPDAPFDVTKTTDEVPYNKNRDLKYFQYSEDYDFYVIDLSSLEYNNEDLEEALFGNDGAIAISLRIIYTDTNSVSHIQTLGLIALNVEASPFTISLDENINVAQWNILIKELASKVGMFTTTSFVSSLPSEGATNVLYVVGSGDEKTYYAWTGSDFVYLGSNELTIGGFVFKGVVATVSNLPSTANIGSYYYVTATNGLYAWNGEDWVSLPLNATLYVPYAGAASDVNLGSHGLTAKSITLDNSGSIQDAEVSLGFDTTNYLRMYWPADDEYFSFYAFDKAIKLYDSSTVYTYTFPTSSGTLATQEYVTTDEHDIHPSTVYVSSEIRIRDNDDYELDDYVKLSCNERFEVQHSGYNRSYGFAFYDNYAVIDYHYYTYTFQEASGTVAFLSDIPEELTDSEIVSIYEDA